jgi:putative oxidoreductase
MEIQPPILILDNRYFINMNMKNFPFISLNQSLVLLRISLAFIFIAHAVVRIANNSITQFGDFLNSKGLAIGVFLVWCITAFEIIGGTLLALGYFKKWLAAGFIFMLIVGIVLIHASLGWFVGEHGTGGSEYSFILIVGLVVVAATKNNFQ